MVLPTSDNLKVANTRLCFVAWGLQIDLNKECSLGYLVETRALVSPVFQVFGLVGGAMRVLLDTLLM